MLENIGKTFSSGDAVLAPLAIAQVIFNLVADLNVSQWEKEIALDLAKQLLIGPRRDHFMTVTELWADVSNGAPIQTRDMDGGECILPEKDQKD